MARHPSTLCAETGIELIDGLVLAAETHGDVGAYDRGEPAAALPVQALRSADASSRQVAIMPDDLGQMLLHRAAAQGVEQLQATADVQERQAIADGRAEERYLGEVALRVNLGQLGVRHGKRWAKDRHASGAGNPAHEDLRHEDHLPVKDGWLHHLRICAPTPITGQSAASENLFAKDFNAASPCPAVECRIPASFPSGRAISHIISPATAIAVTASTAMRLCDRHRRGSHHQKPEGTRKAVPPPGSKLSFPAGISPVEPTWVACYGWCVT